MLRAVDSVIASPAAFKGNGLVASASGNNRRLSFAALRPSSLGGTGTNKKVNRNVKAGMQTANHRQGQGPLSIEHL
jgi:hypothetical protein